MQDGDLEDYSDELCTNQSIERDLKNPKAAFLGKSFDMFSLDTTVISTGLGQLIDEGRIDVEAKPFIHVAIQRQLHPKVLTSQHRKEILLAIQRVVEAA